MSLLKSFFTRQIKAANELRPAGQEAVALFFYGIAPSLDAIAARFPDAKAERRDAPGKERLHLSWGEVSLTITVDLGWDRSQQLTGLRGWMERFPARVRAQARVIELMQSLDRVTACYGTISIPGLETHPGPMNVLKQLLSEGGGFFFSRNSFYDAQGASITGFDEDPVWLGVPPPDA